MNKRKPITAGIISILMIIMFILSGCGDQHKTTASKRTASKATTKVVESVNNVQSTASIQTKNDNTDDNSAAVSSDNVVTEPDDTDINSRDNTTVTKNKAVYILNYHAVDDETFGIEDMFVRPSEFDKQMQFLKDNNYTVISFHDLDKVDSIEKPVIITFDDGYENNYTRAYPILQKYNFKATIFVCPEFFDKINYLTKEQIKGMTDLIDFQSHTLTHPDLTSLSDEQLEKELSESKAIIEGLTGQKVNALAYPSGYFDERIKSFAAKYYEYAVKIGGGVYHTDEDKMQMKRIYISRALDIEGFKAKLQE